MSILGIFIHIAFLFSIFDIYFKSPIVKDITPYQPSHEAVADRIVLFVVDGLRAESFVNYTTMPYLRSIANSHGRWGLSHTRVPTESRPGHVAVIAGFYEDPSAVAKGWKENPVDFDSVFNQTSYTWCWGTYDILEIFTKGNVNDHIFAHKLDPYDQTFSSNKNTTGLDSWVFENVKLFLKKAKHDNALSGKLHQKKIVLFLHLLGTDTSGHTHKPKTENFLQTVKFVDEGIKEIEEIIREFFDNDDKTTFIMTSDHGMTDWGSHGAGDDHETETPYVMWGAGIQQTESKETDPHTKGMSSQHRLDIKQADMAPIMASIISIPVPVNSVGKLPVDLLNMTMENKAKAIYSNSRQLASQYNKKRTEVEENAISVLYQPYEAFTQIKFNEIIYLADQSMGKGDYENVMLLSDEIIHLSLTGLAYYHNYYQIPLLISVSLSFIGWIACLLKTLIEQKVNTQYYPPSNNVYLKNRFINVIFAILFVLATFIVHAQNLPLQYYIYFLMPVCLWWHALNSLNIWHHIFKKNELRRHWIYLEILCYVLGCIAMALSFTYRWMLSIPLLGMGLWPFFSSKRNHLTNITIILWLTGCILLSGFSFIPVVGKAVFIELVLLSGLIWAFTIIAYTLKVLLPLYYNNQEDRKELLFTTIQMVLLLLSLESIYVQSKRFDAAIGVSESRQRMSWCIAGASLILPLASTRRLISRLLSINTSILNIYLLLSVSHEGLFMVSLMFNIATWMFIEFRLLHLENLKIIDCSFEKEGKGVSTKEKQLISIDRSISIQDFRRAFFFLVYIIVAFFGTGNIASLNSFEVRWVTCFITSFQPFIITALILFKTLCPFICVACCFRAVQCLTKAPTGYLNIMVLIYSNLMGIQLLYYVKNTGSWLEIGTSISQFVIVQVITLFIVIINQIAKILTEINIYVFANYVLNNRKKYV